LARALAGEISELTLDRVDKSKLDYYLIQESGDMQEKVLLLILQGSDCNSIFHNDSIKSEYKKVWPTADLLLIEKYGINKNLPYSSVPERVDCPKSYIINDSPKQRVADIKAVLEVVRSQTKYTKLVVLGGSEGAVIANLLSTQLDYVDATVAFNGGGRWFMDDVLHNIVSSQQNSEELKASIDGFKEFSNVILTSEETVGIEVSQHGYNWWRQMLAIDQLDLLQNVNSPLLILQGSADLSVSPQKVTEMVLALGEKDNIKYKVYEGLDHGWENSRGESKRNEVIFDIHTWLKSIL